MIALTNEELRVIADELAHVARRDKETSKRIRLLAKNRTDRAVAKALWKQGTALVNLSIKCRRMQT